MSFRSVFLLAITVFFLSACGGGSGGGTSGGSSDSVKTKRLKSILFTNEMSGETDKLSFTYDQQGRVLTSVGTPPDYERYEFTYGEGLESGLFYEFDDPEKSANAKISYKTGASAEKVVEVEWRWQGEGGPDGYQDYIQSRDVYDYSNWPETLIEIDINYHKDGEGQVTENSRDKTTHHYDDKGRLVTTAYDWGETLKWLYSGDSSIPVAGESRNSSGALVESFKLDLEYVEGECSRETTYWPGRPAWRFLCVET